MRKTGWKKESISGEDAHVLLFVSRLLSFHLFHCLLYSEGQTESSLERDTKQQNTLWVPTLDLAIQQREPKT